MKPLSTHIKDEILNEEKNLRAQKAAILKRQYRLACGNENQLHVILDLSRGTLRKYLKEYFGPNYREDLLVGD